MSSGRVNIISCPVDKKQEQRSVIPFFSPSKTEVGWNSANHNSGWTRCFKVISNKLLDFF